MIVESPLFSIKSSAPKNIATPILIAITIIEYMVICCFVGHVTFFSSLMAA